MSEWIDIRTGERMSYPPEKSTFNLENDPELKGLIEKFRQDELEKKEAEFQRKLEAKGW